jgi:hypothetical protein
MISSAIKAVRCKGIALAWALACAAALAQPAAEATMTRRAAELRESPGDGGRSLASLPLQSAVTRLGARQGPWVQVRSAAGVTGWLHMFDIGAASQVQAAAGAGALRGVSGLFGRSGPATTPTAASGIRGLGAEDIAKAQPNLPAVSQMEALRQSEGEARDFAARAALQSARIEPLPAPRARPATTGHDPSNPGNPQ